MKSLYLREASRGRLYDAVCSGDTEAARGIIAEGIDVANMRIRGRSYFRLAAERLDVRMCELLLDVGADVNATDGTRRYSLLHHAATAGNYGFARLLLDLGANPSPSTTNGATPLHMAARSGQCYLADKLIDAGADINSPDSKGRTPLHCAASNGDLEMAKLLLRRNCDVGIADRRGMTPMKQAMAKGNTEIAQQISSKLPYSERRSSEHAARVAEGQRGGDVRRE